MHDVNLKPLIVNHPPPTTILSGGRLPTFLDEEGVAQKDYVPHPQPYEFGTRYAVVRGKIPGIYNDS